MEPDPPFCMNSTPLTQFLTKLTDDDCQLLFYKLLVSSKILILGQLNTGLDMVINYSDHKVSLTCWTGILHRMT